MIDGKTLGEMEGAVFGRIIGRIAGTPADFTVGDLTAGEGLAKHSKLTKINMKDWSKRRKAIFMAKDTERDSF
jgi:hypothetical protein